MRRAVPLLAVPLAFTGVATLRPGEETGACAQGTAVVPRADCERADAAAAGQTLERCAATTQSFRSVSVRRSGRGLRFAFARRVNRPVHVELRRGGRVVRRFPARTRRANLTHRLRLRAETLRRGTYEVRLIHVGDQGSLQATLFVQRL